MERVEQICYNVSRLMSAWGYDLSRSSSDVLMLNLDGVTSDLDVEALTKGLLELLRELGIYLQTLAVPKQTETAVLQEEIKRLREDLEEKEALIARAMQILENGKETFGRLRSDYERTLYRT